MQKTWVQSLGQEDLLEEEGNGDLLQYFGLENPMTEEPGRLKSMELQKSWARLCNSTATAKAIMNINGKPRSHEGTM